MLLLFKVICGFFVLE